MSEFTFPNEESSQIYQYLFMQPEEYAPVQAALKILMDMKHLNKSMLGRKVEMADVISEAARALKEQFPINSKLDATAGWKERLLGDALDRVDWELVVIALLH